MVLRLGDHDAIDQDAGDLAPAADAATAGSATRSTCAITIPPEFLAAIAMARLSRSSASRSILRLPLASAVVARMKAMFSGNAL